MINVAFKYFLRNLFRTTTTYIFESKIASRQFYRTSRSVMQDCSLSSSRCLPFFSRRDEFKSEISRQYADVSVGWYTKKFTGSSRRQSDEGAAVSRWAKQPQEKSDRCGLRECTTECPLDHPYHHRNHHFARPPRTENSGLSWNCPNSPLCNIRATNSQPAFRRDDFITRMRKRKRALTRCLDFEIVLNGKSSRSI